MLDARVIWVRLSTWYGLTPKTPRAAATTVMMMMAPWGVANLPWSQPRMLGISLSLLIEYVTRTPVLTQARVVPMRARSTVRATITASVVPLWPKLRSPIVWIMSPIGADVPLLLAAAA